MFVFPSALRALLMLITNFAREPLLFPVPLTTRYEPELFPGLVYRLRSPKVVALIFVRYGDQIMNSLSTCHSVIHRLLSYQIVEKLF
jgi:TATA-box binding protein (TBP) (component of TFIID and TFIIIB)